MDADNADRCKGDKVVIEGVYSATLPNVVTSCLSLG